MLIALGGYWNRLNYLHTIGRESRTAYLNVLRQVLAIEAERVCKTLF